jgi:hypothetical protein
MPAIFAAAWENFRSNPLQNARCNDPAQDRHVDHCPAQVLRNWDILECLTVRVPQSGTMNESWLHPPGACRPARWPSGPRLGEPFGAHPLGRIEELISIARDRPNRARVSWAIGDLTARER